MSDKAILVSNDIPILWWSGPRSQLSQMEHSCAYLKNNKKDSEAYVCFLYL